MVKKFRISATSDRFWNFRDFVEFLFENHKHPLHLTLDPEAICLDSLGVYSLLEKLELREVTISTRNPLEAHHIYRINLIDNQWFPMMQSIDHSMHQWNQHKIFYSLYGRPTASRLALASYLREKYPQISHVHFSASIDPDNLVQFEFDKLLQYDVNSMERASRLLKDLPILMSSPDRYTAFNGYDYADPLTRYYQDILIDLVVESHVLGNTFFPTEKTLRPIWLKKPFIVFASRDYLGYLRQMGFHTFNDFWDEDYDGYETKYRLLKIYKLIDYLASLTRDQLLEMYDLMQPILNHNYDLLKSQSYNTGITKIV